jgi:hypothetical protein
MPVLVKASFPLFPDWSSLQRFVSRYTGYYGNREADLLYSLPYIITNETADTRLCQRATLYICVMKVKTGCGGNALGSHKSPVLLTKISHH